MAACCRAITARWPSSTARWPSSTARWPSSSSVPRASCTENSMHIRGCARATSAAYHDAACGWRVPGALTWLPTLQPHMAGSDMRSHDLLPLQDNCRQLLVAMVGLGVPFNPRGRPTRLITARPLVSCVAREGLCWPGWRELGCEKPGMMPHGRHCAHAVPFMHVSCADAPAGGLVPGPLDL